ncbi:DUF1173 family protein [Paraburkholderia acidisoli]|uniref:DUF1173 family protein n=1 Tax=Paraburkholderia acidisoli TaxID=2571748 RepID=UPI002278C73F|nr:DUF1173 family protein [Paraburkholderia acidisoli]
MTQKTVPQIESLADAPRCSPCFQALWHNARLTAWSGNSGTRGWGAVNTMLLGGLGENAKINGCPVHLVLHIMRRYEESERESINAEFNEFLNRLTNDGKLKRRALIVGELGELADMRFGKAITLRQRRHRYFCTDAIIEHAAKTYPHAWRAIGVAGARVVLMMLIERTTNGYVRVVDLAAMLCSSAFLPCDSIHEVAMANRLVNERRVFEKPMRLAEGDDMLPDFVLLDTRPAAHVEVYGMNGLASYEQRKSAKQALRLARGIPVVEWNIDRESLESVALPPPEARA